ncbi:MAG TPA: response regulator transcription factor [Treponemataceae bacterium]|nr:response regulator transcription factor [Treponemataceae bacterium]
MKARILLVDDHSMFREGLGALIGARSDMELVGGATNGKDAIRLVSELAPDFVVMDVSMPEMNGIETTRMIRSSFPNVRVIGLSAHREHHVIVDMLSAGASGYVLKESPFAELIDAIQSLERTAVFVSPAASGPLIMELLHGNVRRCESAFSILTSRELEILQSIAEGKTTKEIASGLSISVKTVETHRAQLMDKLDIHSVAELVKYAIREEITEA